MIDENRQILSPIVDIVSQKPTANKPYRSTRFGGEASEVAKPMDGMPAPFKGSFTGNGQALKNWLNILLHEVRQQTQDVHFYDIDLYRFYVYLQKNLSTE